MKYKRFGIICLFKPSIISPINKTTNDLNSPFTCLSLFIWDHSRRLLCYPIENQLCMTHIRCSNTDLAIKIMKPKTKRIMENKKCFTKNLTFNGSKNEAPRRKRWTNVKAVWFGWLGKCNSVHCISFQGPIL